jgi:hypothetical protein
MNMEHLIWELIDENNPCSLVKQYNNNEQDFPFEIICNSNNDDDLLNKKYSVFKTLLEKFQRSYKELFAISVNETENSNNKTRAKTYSEISSLYVNAIQNLYLNPISYRINELKTKESLRKADESIKIGKRSICWARVSLIVTIVISIISLYITIISLCITIYCEKKSTHCPCYPIEKFQTDGIPTNKID